MKILSSDVRYASSSQSSTLFETQSYTLDREGTLLGGNRVTNELSSQTQASTHYSAKADMVTIRDQARAESALTVEQNSDSLNPLDEDLGKNLYMASVLDWAADTIDNLVEAFQKNSDDLLMDTLSGTRIISTAQSLSGQVTGTRASLYTSMATQLRSQADSLRPVRLLNAGQRIIQTATTEKQTTMVQAEGIVRTADGREIDLSLDMAMHRERTTSSETSVELFRLTDPLVINFSGTAAELSDERITFDLNADGELEQIARLKQGSGFLALDLNKDGIVNDGSELFGPATGNGFQELSFYDQDNNQWIDENDAIYQDLMVWIQDDTGKDVLKKLSETGIGAIHLGSVNSDFLMKNFSGELLGKITSTGIALTEDGVVKTVQQLDLTI